MSQLPEKISGDAAFVATLRAGMANRARVAKAKAFGWLCAGFAIAAVLFGVGLSTAFWGYSHLISVEPAAKESARALVAALETTELKTKVSGVMALAAGTELKLGSGQTIKLAESTTIKLDPGSSVRVVGDLKIDVPQPSKKQLQLDATSISRETPFTDYTIFKSVAFDKGRVETGWSFDLSDPSRPKYQYCKYILPLAKGASTNLLLAVNGAILKLSSNKVPLINVDAAALNCIWFSGA